MALLHNPNPKARSPLALWVSFDGMKTWPYQRVLRGDLEGRFNYPDGFVSADRQWLHFAFDHNRDRAIHVSARLPQAPVAATPLWDATVPLPKSAELPREKKSSRPMPTALPSEMMKPEPRTICMEASVVMSALMRRLATT